MEPGTWTPLIACLTWHTVENLEKCFLKEKSKFYQRVSGISSWRNLPPQPQLSPIGSDTPSIFAINDWTIGRHQIWASQSDSPFPMACGWHKYMLLLVGLKYILGKTVHMPRGGASREKDEVLSIAFFWPFRSWLIPTLSFHGSALGRFKLALIVSYYYVTQKYFNN